MEEKPVYRVQSRDIPQWQWIQVPDWGVAASDADRQYHGDGYEETEQW
jgi:hypothetical protein